MRLYTRVPALYAVASAVAFALLCAAEWISPDFLRYGHTDANKTFFGRPVETAGQYWSLLIISFLNALFNTFYRELTNPFWINVVSPEEPTRRRALQQGMGGSICRLFKANVEAELYLKFSHLMTLFLCLVDIWVVLAQLLGSTLGSSAVIYWWHCGKTRARDALDDPPLLV